MSTRIATIALLLALVASAAADARVSWLGREGLGVGKLGAAGSKGSNGAAPTGCTNGNLLLVYSDPCQLMSQAVGL